MSARTWHADGEAHVGDAISQPIPAASRLASARTPPVRLSAAGAGGDSDFGELPDDLDAALRIAPEWGRRVGHPGEGRTLPVWETLATLGAHDLGVARALEPHLDAVAILSQQGLDAGPGTWGVFAAEGGDDPLTARARSGRWTLAGTKPWCSLADRLDSALITAVTETGQRRLFAVDLHDDRVLVEPGAWHSRGLAELPSGPVLFQDVPATPIGEAGWYLSRPGFEWGGIGVAACWYGGAVGIARTIHAAAAAKPNPFLLAHLGAIDEGLTSCRVALADAAAAVDSHASDLRIRAKRVRATVARVCEDVILRAGHALGPAPLALDEQHAKRVADLTVYIRQHHAERDLESLGRALAEGGTPW